MTRRSVSRRCLRATRIPALAFAALSATIVFAEDSIPGDGITARMKEIFDFNRKGIVSIQSTDPRGLLEGTGFYADSTGTIYTGLGVIGDGTNITVIQGMRKLPARLEVADPRTGIALLKVETTTPYLPIGDSSKVDVYTPLVTIGYPFNKPAVWSAGLVASLDKQYLQLHFYTTLVRAQLPVQPGFGGAPVLNLKGEVVGIVVAGIEENTGCFILPINAAEKVRTDFNRFHRLKPGWIGLHLKQAEDNSLPSTALVDALQPDAPAVRAGIREGDILLRVGDIPIHTREDMLDGSFFLTADDETSITVLRNGVEQKFTVRAAENPSSPSSPNGSAQAESSILTLESAVAPAPSR